MFGKLIYHSLAVLLVGFLLAGMALAQAQDSAQLSKGEARLAPAKPPQSSSARDEGELIELEEVQIHGEIAQPNVAITVARAEPMFREITLEHTAAEGITDLDFSGLRTQIPPVARLKNWEEILKRSRQ